MAPKQVSLCSQTTWGEVGSSGGVSVNAGCFESQGLALGPQRPWKMLQALDGIPQLGLRTLHFSQAVLQIFQPVGLTARLVVLWIRARGPSPKPGVQVFQLAAKLLLLLSQDPDVGAQRLHEAGQHLLFLSQGGHLAPQLCQLAHGSERA